MENPRYELRSTGLGIRNWIKRRTAKTSERRWFAVLFFNAILRAAPFTKIPLLDFLIRRVALLSDRHHTAGYTIPINVDLSDLGEEVTLPVELMRKSVRESTCRVLLDECVCRDVFHCKDYPVDLGCIFLGKAAMTLVDSGIGHEATVEECIAHIDRAAELGLPGKAYWVEIEEFVWGFKDQEMTQFLELCFCCPCCCGALKFDRLAGDGARKVLNRSIGWTSVVQDSCVGCGACIEACPRNLIRESENRVEIDSLCSGCGTCVNACSHKALKLEQKQAIKKDLLEYFEGLDLEV